MGHSKWTSQTQTLFCCRAKFWLNSGNSHCPVAVKSGWKQSLAGLVTSVDYKL